MTVNAINGDGQISDSFVLTVNDIPAPLLVFHHADHLSGASVDTDISGNVLEVIDYYPFGESRIDEKSTTYANDYTFTGKELDEDTKLYYYEARYYNPKIARFVSQDPWEGDLKDPQSLNKYAYVRNNPLKYVDQTGRDYAEAIEALKTAWLTGFGTAMVDSPVPGPADVVAAAIVVGGTIYAIAQLFDEGDDTQSQENSSSIQAQSSTDSGGSNNDDENNKKKDEKNRGNIEKLNKGETDRLKDNGYDIHEIKQDLLGKGSSDIAKFDLFKDKTTGDIVLMLKNGTGEAIETGLNIKNFFAAGIAPQLPNPNQSKSNSDQKTDKK
ncbi:hypothetical protein HZA38_02970 [Candidatus Peregrinibacteria bacterium]|nr:hypothetical protein [Candidatus Peregrinibacteria bacterium]